MTPEALKEMQERLFSDRASIIDELANLPDDALIVVTYRSITTKTGMTTIIPHGASLADVAFVKFQLEIICDDLKAMLLEEIRPVKKEEKIGPQ